MSQNDMNIGEQINTMCNHGGLHVKSIEDMQICVNGKQYCMELVKSGEMSPIQCEPCLIAWLCDDPIETCVNPEDAIQWHTQCVQTVSFWVNLYETWVKPLRELAISQSQA